MLKMENYLLREENGLKITNRGFERGNMLLLDYYLTKFYPTELLIYKDEYEEDDGAGLVRYLLCAIRLPIFIYVEIVFIIYCGKFIIFITSFFLLVFILYNTNNTRFNINEKLAY